MHVSCVVQVKNYQLYVRREIQNQSSLRHPLIVSLREASIPTHLTLQASGNAINSSLSVQNPRPSSISPSNVNLLHLQQVVQVGVPQVCRIQCI